MPNEGNAKPQIIGCFNKPEDTGKLDFRRFPWPCLKLFHAAIATAVVLALVFFNFALPISSVKGQVNVNAAKPQLCYPLPTDTSKVFDKEFSSDTFLGELHFNSEGIPVNFELLEFETYIGYRQQVEPIFSENDFWDGTPLNLFFELQDSSGNTVHCTIFQITNPIGIQKFFVRVPDPPKYDRIVISNFDAELFSLNLSPNAPSIKIVTPRQGSTYCYGDIMRQTEQIKLSWESQDLEESELNYSVWYSRNGGETYELYHRNNSNSLWLVAEDSPYPHLSEISDRSNSNSTVLLAEDLFETQNLLIRVYAFNKTRSAYDEIHIELSDDLESCVGYRNDMSKTEFSDCMARQTSEPERTRTTDAFISYIDMLNAEVSLTHNGEIFEFYSSELDSYYFSHRKPHEYTEDRLSVLFELIDAEGDTVHCILANVYEMHGDYTTYYQGKIRTRDRRWGVIRAIIQNPLEYDSINVYTSGVKIAEINRSPNAPQVSLIAGPEAGEVFDNKSVINLAWNAIDIDEDTLEHIIYYSTNGGKDYNHYRYLVLYPNDGIQISANELKGSTNARFLIIVRDGTRSAFVETPEFTVLSHPSRN